MKLNLDMLGACASTVCMVHCLAMPLLLTALPMWNLTAGESQGSETQLASLNSTVVASTASTQCAEGDCCADANAATGAEGGDSCCSTPTDFWIHVGLLSTVAPLGLLALGSGYRRHRRFSVAAVGIAGVLLLTGALLFGTQLLGGRGEQIMTVTGSLLMMSAHLWNRRECRCCSTPELGRLIELEAQADPKPVSLPSGGVS